MTLFRASDRKFAQVFPRLVTSNPFLDEWVHWERQALGAAFKDAPPRYSRQVGWEPMQLHPNVVALGERVASVTEHARRQLVAGVQVTAAEVDQYQDLALYHLYQKRGPDLDAVVQQSLDGKPPAKVAAVWDAFDDDWQKFVVDAKAGAIPGARPFLPPEHVFAWFFQLRRAFYHIYALIVGTSAPAARLRGAVWQSIFTQDIRRWHRILHDQMEEFPTLITGPSGSGKELVASAIGLSRYIPWVRKNKAFAKPFAGSFYPLNLSALAPTLIESELFGHNAGSFTGALKDRKGWLEECQVHYGAHGTVFLDEIGELDLGIQVKLLRVLQARQYSRLGESSLLEFEGKIISATNRDLATEMQAGRFRKDLYYRLCADRIRTPSLREQLDAAPGDLHLLIGFTARRVLSTKTRGADAQEVEALATEVEHWIDTKIARDYSWPGNFRELEQCVRNILIRQTYEPAQHSAAGKELEPVQELATGMAVGALSLEDLQRRYITLVYARSRSLQHAAEQLGCNWRTVRSKIDHTLLHRLREP